MFHTHSSGGDPGSAAVYRTLITALLLTLAFSSIEAVAGWYAHSLALLSDAGHMLSDGLALGLAGLSAWLGQRAPSRLHSYGLGRSELLAALFNTLLMLGIVIAIVASAVDRLQSSSEVGGETVTVVALIGLLINGLVAWLLSRGERNLNLQAALLHVLGDLLGSLAALVSGLVILWTHWTPIDAILSLCIAVLILISSFKLLRRSLHLLLDGVPPDVDLAEVGRSLNQIVGVGEVHDLHIWHLSASRTALTAHLVVDSLEEWDAILAMAHEILGRRFDIGHITLQPELRTGEKALYRIAEPN